MSKQPKRREKKDRSDVIQATGSLLDSPELALLELKQFPVEAEAVEKFKNKAKVSAHVFERSENIWGVAVHFVVQQYADENIKAQISADYIFTVEHNQTLEFAGKVQDFSEFVIVTSVWPQFNTLVGTVGSQTDPTIAPPPKSFRHNRIKWVDESELINQDDK